MRCPDCNKFVSLESQEPEVNLSVEYECEEQPVKIHHYRVTGDVRLARACGECGTELKEAHFDVEVTVDVLADEMPLGVEDPSDAVVDEDGSEATEEGGGRYAKSYFGVHVDFSIRCDQVEVATGNFEDKVAASAMDELA